MGNVNSQPKSTDSAASPMPQADNGIGIAAPATAAAGHMIAGLSISSAGDDGEKAEASNRGRDEVQNTSTAENRGGEEAKDTSGPPALEKNTQFLIQRGQRDCFSFVQTGSCKFGSICWYNHPQRSTSNLNMQQENEREAFPHKIGMMKLKKDIQEKEKGTPSKKLERNENKDRHGKNNVEACSQKTEKMKYKKDIKEKEKGTPKKLQRNENKNMQRENEREASPHKIGMMKLKKDIKKETGTPPKKLERNENKKDIKEKEKETPPEKLERNENKDIRRENNKDASSQKTGKMRYKNMQSENEREASPQKTGTMKCKYFSQGHCKFGKDCRFVHSDKQIDVSSFELNFLGLPLRPGEIDCFSYMETGNCKVATRCKYNHPDPIAVSGQDLQSGYQSGGSSQLHVPESLPFSSPNEGILFYNASLPYVPGVVLPAQGSYPNSQWNGYQASAYPYSPNLSSGPPTMPLNDTPTYSPNMSNGPPTLPMDYIPRSIDVPVHHETPSDCYPERPCQKVCNHFMKTGHCKFKSACKFHHPKSRLSSTSANANAKA